MLDLRVETGDLESRPEGGGLGGLHASLRREAGGLILV